jgi:esterase/lipase superfamily enzyme
MEYWTHNDLGSDRHPGPLTWLSRVANHESGGYSLDRQSAAADGAPGLPFLLQRIQDLKPKKIAIVAHSMGSYVLVQAIESDPAVFAKIDRLVFVASDLPADALGTPKLREAIKEIPKVHVYWSRNDEALAYSELLNGRRLGMYGPTPVGPTNIYSHDSTFVLGATAVHSKYLTRSGAGAVHLADALQ